MENLHGREYAEQLLNEWFDEIGVDESRRIEIDDVEDAELEHETSDDVDVIREKVIMAIRRKQLTLSDNKEFQYRLLDPIKKDSGEILVSDITIQNRYKHADFRRNMVGVKQNDMFGMFDAQIAARCKMSRIAVGNLYDRDYGLLQSIVSLFTRAEYTTM